MKPSFAPVLPPPNFMQKIIFAVLLVGSLLSCGKSFNDAKVLRVGVTPVPAGEVMAEAVSILTRQGIEVQIVSFTDYIQPNLALSTGDIDANLYQNIPFMKQFNQDRGTQIVSVEKIYGPPMGIYAGRVKNLAQLPNRAEIAIPNDPVNLGRALLLLQEAGLLQLKNETGTTATVADITSNPKNIQIKELEAAQIPRALPDVDVAVINANYAMDSGLHPIRNSLYYEKDIASYANVLAAREDNQSDPRIQALAKALTSPELRTFLETRYQGAVIPAF